MLLTLEQIRSATTGAVCVVQSENEVQFHRMSPAQVEAVGAQRDVFVSRARTTAGVRLTFRTDSSRLFLRVNITNALVRTYFAVDVYADDTYIGGIDNYSHLEGLDRRAYSALSFPYGCHSGTFDLGPGEKTVRIHLPWSMACAIRELSLEDGSSFSPAVPHKKILFFGDSITQGYDALHPSLTYASRISHALGMAEYNKAIGGAAYCPALAAVKEDFVPDAIVVAYGSNDWGASPTADFFREQCRQMYRSIRSNYPDTPVFALGPILRHNSNECRGFGAFCKLGQIIGETAGEFPCITFIDCLTFLPRASEYYGDGIVHPNDKGFDYYFKGLWNKMRSALTL